ncbi:MAG: FMN-binding protein [Candidatus Marinimicrobia bacterium]|nr:FMN-binding protein [Candidatus Neomarinimicrobiota bacterium]
MIIRKAGNDPEKFERLRQQKVKVDAVTGATISSKCIMITGCKALANL